MAPAVTGPVASMLQRALAALHDEDSALRAQLMGRMAAAVAFRDVEHRRPLLARQALQMARRLADKATLADVLASHWATHGPDTLDESIGLAEELGHVADEIGDSRLRTLAHARLIDYLLERGDIDGVQRELDALQRLARTRSERTFKWVLGVFAREVAELRARKRVEFLARLCPAIELRIEVGERAAPSGDLGVLPGKALVRLHELVAAYGDRLLHHENAGDGLVVAFEAVREGVPRQRRTVLESPLEVGVIGFEGLLEMLLALVVSRQRRSEQSERT